MKCNILHETPGRMRVHLALRRMSLREADLLEYDLKGIAGVVSVKVFDRTQDAVITYTGARADVLHGAAAFRFDVQALTEVSANSPRAVNHEYQEKLVNLTLFHFARKLFLPAPIRFAYTAVCSVRYLWHGLRSLLHRRLEVEVLDALSIGVSMLRGDIPAKQLLAKAPVMSYAVSEYVFLQADSEQDAAQAVKILQTRIDSQADGDAFYPETIDQWKAAKVLQNGAYVAMIASGEHQTEIEDAWNAQFGA